MNNDWRSFLIELKKIRRTFGHCRVPFRWSGNPALGKWVQETRNHFGRLSLEELKQLFSVGFDFGADRYWLSRFLELTEFKNTYGHCNVPINWCQNPQLGQWLSYQRARKSQIPIQRKKLFDRLGMDWAPLESAWNKKYEELLAYKKRFGHCRVLARWAENPSLATWVGNMRHRPHALTPKQKLLLDRIGFDWDPRRTMFLNHFEELKKFKERFGHFDVPTRWPPNTALATWAFHIRCGKRKMASQEIRLLRKIGFDFRPQQTVWWEVRFQELAAFKKRFGHCRVPKEWRENPQLGTWVGMQRSCKKMSDQRRKRLNDLGFEWQLIKMSPRASWEDRFSELTAFKQRYGHCRVPDRWPENVALARWVRRQQSRDNKRLTRSQKRRLEKLGFEWELRNAQWDKRFADLVLFRKKHGHCDVPAKWPENAELGRWVSHQRGRKSTLSRERISRLEKLGFRWRVGTPRR